MNYLKDNGFMKYDKNQRKWTMKTMRELMDKDTVADEDVPKNCLHLFQCTTWDFGLQKDEL